ncbi:beta strand repeat-containing protein, partial [Mycolicibacterium chlorophenolicum]|uniref:beta strand repeat-containing protein n=1 Tax=Mycolicibacterium chlorophenolicum TaxID=37916 RepID=UPI00389945D6
MTFTGAASVSVYQQLLQSVTLTSPSAGIVTVSFIVTDDQGQSSVPASTIVTVLGLPVAAAPLVVTAPVAAGTAGGAVTVSPVVAITDIDSTQLASATVTTSGGSLSYGTLPSGVTATPSGNSVTFTGAASVSVYQQLLQLVTLTSASPAIATVSFSVTDDQGQSSVPASTIVTVVGLPVAAAPLIVAAPAAAGTSGSPVTVSPAVSITDIDSTQLASATVSASGGSLSYGTLPSGVSATVSGSSVTFTGGASIASYQQLLQSVTFTSPDARIATVTFTVTDDRGQTSVPSTTVVTVVGLAVAVPPLVVVAPVAAGTAGVAVTVSPAVVITDIDSDELSSATIHIEDPAAGDTLGYGTLPSGVTATPGTGSVMFTGLASVTTYQQLLQTITLTSSSTGIKTVLFTVTDDQGGSSVPTGTAVTVLGLPPAVAPLVVTAPIAAGVTGSAVAVSPVVVVTDLDSAQMSSATVSASGIAGLSLGYGALPDGVTAAQGPGSVTFSGAASIAAYQQLLQSVTLTSTTTGIATLTFTITDELGEVSSPANTIVTVLAAPAAVAPLVVTAPLASGTAGSSVVVSPVVLITDIDSPQLASATVSVSGGAGGILAWDPLPNGVTATLGANSVTFTGAATVAAYQQLLQSVTLTVPNAAIVTVSFSVTDDQGQSSTPGTTIVTLVGLPVAAAPLVVTAPTAIGTTGTATTVSPIVAITDIDSTHMSSATVTTDTPGFTLGYGPLPQGITATSALGSVTFTGAASVDAYEQLLQSVTVTSVDSGIASVSFGVTDAQGVSSLLATTIVTMLGVALAAAPLVVTAPTAAGTKGSAIAVSPAVVITDIDSTDLASATVSVSAGAGVSLNYGTLPNGVTATPSANSVTFTGVASVTAYEQLLQSVTLTSPSVGIVSVSFTVTDDQGQASVPSTTVVTVLGLPVAAAPLVVLAPVAAGTAGGPVTVSPVVSITDIDSTQLASATVTSSGGSLNYGALPIGVTATAGANSVTFTGAASVTTYEQLLQSITLTSSDAGITTVSFTVTDDQGQASVPSATVVTVLASPVAAAPLVVTAPVAAGTAGSAVTVSSVVVITDIDSTQLASATVTSSGGSLNYGTLPSGVTATPGANSVTFTGPASVAAYQQLLQSVTLTSSSTTIVTVTFTVADDQGQSSAPSATAVTVLGVPVAVAPLVVTAPTAAGSTGGAITVSPVVVITDVDSTQLASATVSVSGTGVLGYGTLPSGVTATPDANSVTFTGAASVAAYEQLLQSVTLTSSAAGITTVTFTVTDDQGQASVPAATVVTVLGVPVAVAPLVVTAPTAAGATGTPVTVSPVVVVTDVDSTQLASATVSVTGSGVLGYGTLPSGVTATPGTNSVTFTGPASVAAYQQLLQSITLTSSTTGINTVTFTVTDDQGQSSVPATTVVTVLGVPVAIAPLVVTAPTAAGSTGGVVTVSPVVVITDVDSTELASATVSVDGTGVLGYGTLPSGVIATAGSGSVTFTGAASVAAYQQLLQSITLASSAAGITTVTFTVTDDQGESSVPAATVVTVLGVPVAVAPLVVTAPTAAGSTGGAVTVSPVVVITDVDSTQLVSATVSVTGTGVLGYGALPSGVTATPGTNSVTFTGAASVAAYQQLLQSITLTSSSTGINTVTFTVTDDQGQASVPATTAVTVLGVPVALAPLVVTAPTATGTAGTPVTVSL